MWEEKCYLLFERDRVKQKLHENSGFWREKVNWNTRRVWSFGKGCEKKLKREKEQCLKRIWKAKTELSFHLVFDAYENPGKPGERIGEKKHNQKWQRSRGTCKYSMSIGKESKSSLKRFREAFSITLRPLTPTGENCVLNHSHLLSGQLMVQYSTLHILGKGGSVYLSVHLWFQYAVSDG